MCFLFWLIDFIFYLFGFCFDFQFLVLLLLQGFLGLGVFVVVLRKKIRNWLGSELCEENMGGVGRGAKI